MSSGPIRRAQLIAPFGVGAMMVVRDGISLIAAGLDHWYVCEEDRQRADDTEFRVEEWRLARQLQVGYFKLPPDYRPIGKGFGNTSVPNGNLRIPYLRFPQWHSCSTCGTLKHLPLTARGKQLCLKCKAEGRYGVLNQVSLVVMCPKGHLQDFPWREWVHRDVNPSCQLPMRLISTGSATLAGQKVKCGCGKERSLSGVTYQNMLSNSLAEDDVYLCRGQRPWLGTEKGELCDEKPTASLRSATNVYYAQTSSAIFIPRGGGDVPEDLLDVLTLPVLALMIGSLGDAVTPEMLRKVQTEQLKSFNDEQIRRGIDKVRGENKQKAAEPKDEEDFRREEYKVLRAPREEINLRIRQADLSNYDQDVAQFFSRLTLIDKLRETRALYGFTRILPETSRSPQELQTQLRRQEDPASWLPAYVVYGEGIFLELSEQKIQAWLQTNHSALHSRLQDVIDRDAKYREARELSERNITARLFLVHTFAHLLIRQLTFACGYSAASLRERLYISDNSDSPMAALLIYTASGDAEGTMGGLVRMGKPGWLEPVIRKAILGAAWCSSDPVCMESGSQQVERGNVAACHSCVLLPETSCEHFNTTLDRGVIVGNFDDTQLGFFSSLMSQSAD